MDDATRLTNLLLETDPYLTPYRQAITRRLERIDEVEQRLTGGKMSLVDFASGHLYFGLHRDAGEWVFREWAPNAVGMHLISGVADWREHPEFALRKLNSDGVWEIRLPGNVLRHGDLYRLRIHWRDGSGDRIPAYAGRVVQDPDTLIFNAQVWLPETPYPRRHPEFVRKAEPLLVYEAHVGMAQDAERVGTYVEFTENMLPRIKTSGYNAIQLMAVQEHPYYGSFGYHVSNFFAASSRFGTPEDLKALIDAAHGAGLSVIMDLVHSHAVSNTVEGLGLFDGTPYQYFHEGDKGHHPAWDSKCFNYNKPQVLHFLLSNCRYWLDEYRVDGFRFDGITSMLYTHHGLGTAFTSYDAYFDQTVDEDALVYLALANRLVHTLRPDALTVAEDISGMPGLALAASSGGFGFDYRFAMGIPDYWIRLTKDIRDEDWPIGELWHELTNRRAAEKTISYAESHDQALVGDKTLMFRMADARMYDHMQKVDDDPVVDRAMALHKMIRLITIATAGGGYLNFMGNEFGHPEWVDFPREGNQWSYKHARRCWYLADHPDLKYQYLNRFDKEMIALVRDTGILAAGHPSMMWEHTADKVVIFSRGDMIFAFNFHPTTSYTDYAFPAPEGVFKMVLDSDDPGYGGHGRLTSGFMHHTLIRPMGDGHTRQLQLYLPSRTALVLKNTGG
ncbi:MAG: 1,4-alpha-glucan-branching enzyme [Desulfobacteraceae bacterium]|nr:1,4-alpha-glucan-branching enzyme [Desulfobacteraceae bacterium]